MSTSTEIGIRLDEALTRWVIGLEQILYPVGFGDYYTLTPIRTDRDVPFDAVAGDQFAATAVAYWMHRKNKTLQHGCKLSGLVRYSLVTHVCNSPGTEFPAGSIWGATMSDGNDWHANLFPSISGALMWDGLDPNHRAMLERILIWEADFHSNLPPGAISSYPYNNRREPGFYGRDSNGESMAWATTLLVAARWRTPENPNHSDWTESAIAHAINATGIPEDRTSSQTINGRPLADWHCGANFTSAFLQSHHYFLHPGYMAWPLASLALAQLMDRASSNEPGVGEACLLHWQEIYARLMQLCLHNGRLIYPSGYDWNLYGYGNTRLLSASIFAAGHFQDVNASRFAVEYLGLIESQQSRNGGLVQADRMVTQRVLFPNRYAWYEGIEGLTLAESLWMLERLPDLPLAADEEEFHASTAGDVLDEDTSVVWHRDTKAFVSFSWNTYRGGGQFLFVPLRDPHLLKWNAQATGRLAVRGAAQDIEPWFYWGNPKESIWPKEFLRNLQWRKIKSFDGGGFLFQALFHLGAWENKRNMRPLVRQWLTIVCMPGHPVVFVDRCMAFQEIEVDDNLSLQIRLAADYFNGNELHLVTGSTKRCFPQAEEDTWHSLGRGPITVNKSLRIVPLAGDGEFHLMQKSRRQPEIPRMIYGELSQAAEESLVAHELYWGDRTSRLIAEGTEFQCNVLALAVQDENQEISRALPLVQMERDHIRLGFADEDELILPHSPD